MALLKALGSHAGSPGETAEVDCENRRMKLESIEERQNRRAKCAVRISDFFVFVEF